MFLVEYEESITSSRAPKPSLTITKSGKQIGSFHMDQTSFDGRDAFATQIKFLDSKDTGALYAHFRLTMGSISVKRDRRFVVSR